MRKKNGFTLIELLVVIAIIALLMAIYHKWKGIETIKQGRDNVRTWVGLFNPVTEEGKEDVQWIQRGIWGSLGYDAF